MKRTIEFCGREVTVDFDYDGGEPQWFDARAGVGSPGFPPSVRVNAFELEGERTTLEDVEQQIIDLLVAEESEAGCDRPEPFDEELINERRQAEAYWNNLTEDKKAAREGEV